MSNKTMPIIRKPKFDWDGMNNHYIENSYFGTHFVNSMHVVFPDGEKFFVRSVRQFADRIQDPNLKERVKAFIGQEMQHMNQHQSFWDFLKKQSPALEVFHKIYTNAVYTHFEEFLRSSELGNKMALSITAALEHYTAILGEAVLENNCEVMSGIPEEMRDMLKWHAAEELEHKAVAYDVLEEIDDSYVLRAAGMIYATVSLSFFLALGQSIFMLYDREIPWTELPGQFFRFLKKISPLAKGVADNWLDYFRPNFHPDDIDNLYLAEEVFKDFQEYMDKKKAA